MMKILSINNALQHEVLSIHNIQESALSIEAHIEDYDYIIINGGDGTVRRVVKILHTMPHHASVILNPTGSFNVIAKLHRVPKLKKVLDALSQKQTPLTTTHTYYSLNKEVFLFSAGNMGDVQHILLSETLRFGILKNGMAKYLLSVLFLLPVHLIMTPFMLLSKSRFFIFTPASYITKFGSFYGKVDKELHLNLHGHYNHLELDGDVVTIKEALIHIQKAGELTIVNGLKP